MKKIGYIITIFFFLTSFLGQAQEERIEPRIDISYFKSGDDVPYLKVFVRKRIERRYYPMTGVKFKAYFNDESQEANMGEAMTNEKGEGVIEMPNNFMLAWHELDVFDFFISMEETDSTEEVSESLTIRKARIQMDVSDDKMIKVLVEQKGEEDWSPVEEIEVKLFIKRYFGRLPVTEDYLESDEDGNVEVEFKGEIPGDEESRLILGCMIEDHEEFGNVIAYSTTTWGIPTIDDNKAFARRTLWSTRDKTPYWLLIFPNLIIAGVWGVIGYLFLQIYKIKKLSKIN